MTPYYSDDAATVYHADCLPIMRSMPSESVDIVVTSPPYNMGLVPGGNGQGMYRPGANSKAGRFRDGYGIHGDAMPQDEYNAWQRECLAEMWRIARMAIYYNHRPRVEHGVLRWPLGLDFGIPLRQVIVWDRGTGIDVNLRAYCTRQEHIYLFAKPAFQLVDTAASGAGDVWRLGMDYEEKEHPAPFPVALPARAIYHTGAKSILDPFLGSGTTLVAAKAAGIIGVGMEIEERWCRRAVARLAQESLWPAAVTREPGHVSPLPERKRVA
jgi:site-specific DNA-methyltransferase (adenine-specific)